MAEYKQYSWSMFNGYEQTIRDGKVIDVRGISVGEAQKKYYATRGKADQKKDSQLEAEAGAEMAAHQEQRRRRGEI